MPGTGTQREAPLPSPITSHLAQTHDLHQITHFCYSWQNVGQESPCCCRMNALAWKFSSDISATSVCRAHLEQFPKACLWQKCTFPYGCWWTLQKMPPCILSADLTSCIMLFKCRLCINAAKQLIRDKFSMSQLIFNQSVLPCTLAAT